VDEKKVHSNWSTQRRHERKNLPPHRPAGHSARTASALGELEHNELGKTLWGPGYRPNTGKTSPTKKDQKNKGKSQNLRHRATLIVGVGGPGTAVSSLAVSEERKKTHGCPGKDRTGERGKGLPKGLAGGECALRSKRLAVDDVDSRRERLWKRKLT